MITKKNILTFIFHLIVLLNNTLILKAVPIKSSLPFNKVIIWGHKLHSHTHSYIHWGFYRAFKHLGYDTYWFDNDDNVQNFNFSNSLFLSEHQVDQKMPLRDDCFYILHNCYLKHYEKHKNQYDKGRCISLQVYRHEYINDNAPKIEEQLAKNYFYYDTKNNIKVDDFIYYNLKDQIIYIPWATDLLPHEIEEIQKELPHIIKQRKKTINYIGTFVSELEQFKKACIKNNISFNLSGGYSQKHLSMEENIKKIQESYLAPAIQRKSQVDQGYIPCRILKNISYGHLGITNSKTVYELLNKKIVYNPNIDQLFYDAQKKLKNLDINELYELMNFVKNNHTYLNRIEILLSFLEKVYHSNSI